MKKTLALWMLVLCYGTAWAQNADTDGITLNLKNADLSALIQTVSRFTNRSFIVDPRVKGRVTVISAEKLDPEAVYNIFLEVLSVHGYSIIPGRNSERIIPSGQVRSAPQPLVPNGIESDTSNEAQRSSFITRIVKVKEATASQMVSLLRPLIAKEGHLAAHNDSNSLILSENQSNMPRILKIIKELDVAEKQSLEAIPLRFAAATDVAQTLQKLLTGQKGKSSAKNIKLIADKRSNSILVKGSQKQREDVHKMIREIDRKVPDDSNIKVVHLRYADVENVAPIIANLLSGLKTKSETKDKTTTFPSSIQPEPNTNSLIISGDSGHIRTVERIIEDIDIQRDQVVVEAIIAELGVDVASELGVQWFSVDGESGAPLGLTNFGTADLLSLLGGASSAPNLGDGLSLAVGDFTGGSLSTGAIIKALQRDGSTNILSTPNILTLDNQEATITVGQDVPFRTGQYTSSDSGSNPFETIERSRVGLTLKVTPQISRSGSITLDIVQEVSSVVPDANLSFAASDVVTRIRQIETSVSVQDGHLLAIGGLIDDQFTQDVYKVPLLGDLPAIGALFRNKRDSTIKRSLVVFLRPTVLRNTKDADDFSQRKYSYFREEGEKFRAHTSSDNSRKNSTILPPLKAILEIPPPFELSR